MEKLDLIRAIVREAYKSDDDVNVDEDARVEWAGNGAWVTVQIFVTDEEVAAHTGEHVSKSSDSSERRCECGAPYDAARGGFTCAR